MYFGPVPKRLRLVIALAGVLALQPIPGALSARTVPVRTVDKGNGASSSLTQRSAFVVKTARRWRAVWQSLHASVHPRPVTPRVDFARHMLLVAIQGRRRSGGYSVRVARVRDEGRRWRVTIHERSPGVTCIVPAVITSPYHVVRVWRSSDMLRFVRTRRTRSC